MEISSFAAEIQMCDIEKTFTYNNTPMISFSVRYPKIALLCGPAAQNGIAQTIQAQINAFYQEAAHDLCPLAISDYQNALENGFPFHPYDATLQYTVTYNQNGHLSLYHDHYTFTGGAHGSTVRASDTWSLPRGQHLPLSHFFPKDPNYRTTLIRELTRQADERMRENPGIFFDNYRELISEAFREDHYYLTPAGIDIYYQQYDIAPYSTGIVVFTIPYAEK